MDHLSDFATFCILVYIDIIIILIVSSAERRMYAVGTPAG